MIPVFIIAFCVSFPYHELTALIVFIVASASDAVDGHIARSRNLITDFGKFMDPLADKLLVSSAFVCLVGVQFIPAWIVILILAREFAVTGLRTLAANDGVVIAASKWGKAKTVSQMIAIISLLLFMVPSMNFSWLWSFGQIMVYVCAVLTLVSGIDYFVLNKGVFKSM
ncbi:MAG: CDP-diacylglycerol--glycerol-3-phosphate 3-phosphatidyltransferase [Eubacteriaceae bacterium]